MILNISRAKDFMKCREYSWNLYERRLIPVTEADTLIVGEATHAGMAGVLAGETGRIAAQMAVESLENRLSQQAMLLPEERQMYDNWKLWIVSATMKYAEAYKGFQVIMPEVKFVVKLENTIHHCWYCHKLLYPSIPYDGCEAFRHEKTCWQSHYLKGRSDGLVQFENQLWLLEHKTSSVNTDNYWSQWQLDMQITGYIYGIWKSTGLLPAGALLNKISKPSKKTKDWTQVSFDREPILRSREDLEEFEVEIKRIATDFETAFRTQNIYKNPSSCFDWNRRCYYHQLCLEHGRISDKNAWREKPQDYVEEEYRKLLGLEVSNDKV